LVTSQGFGVAGKSGPISLPPGKIDISQTGEIEVNGTPVDTTKVVDFRDKSQLEKAGHSLFQARPGAAEQEMTEAVIRQGSLEQSNVNPVQQMMFMISMMRQFEGLQKAIHMVMNNLNDRSINQVGRTV
jgi:flagellar basal-body rod protein FlgG